MGTFGFCGHVVALACSVTRTREAARHLTAARAGHSEDSHPTDRNLLLVEVSGRAVSRAHRRSGSSSNTATHQHQPKHLGVSCLSQVSSESKLAIKLESA